METQEYQTLVQTLMSNHLAASASEAQRMAKEMLGISEKVHNDAKKEQHYMIKGFKPQGEHVAQASGRPNVDMSTGLPINEVQQSQSSIAVEPQMKQQPLQPEIKNTSMPDPALQGSATGLSNNEHMQEKINELRNRAINPEPVNVQVNFQTPNMDREQQKPPVNEAETMAQEEINEILQSPLQNSEPAGQSTPASTQSQPMTPEEYSAQKFGNTSTNNLQSDFLSLKTPQQQTEEKLNSDWPAQQPQTQTANHNPSTSVNAQPSMEQTFQEEAKEESTKEIKTENKSNWTAEDEKLKQEVDLTRVFNFSNK